MSDWPTVALREVADIRVSNVDKKFVHGDLPVRLCNYMDVYSNDYIREGLPFMEAGATAAEIERFGVRRGDVMITKDSETPDDIGIPAVVIDDMENVVCGYHLAQIRPKTSVIDPVYLAKHLALPEVAAYFAQRATGSTRYGLSNRTIAEVPIRLAPLVSQQRIAAILTGLDKAIEATDALIEKHQQIKAGLVHDLLTRGLDSDGKMRRPRLQSPSAYVETAIGWLPRGWRIEQLGELLVGAPKNGFSPREATVWEGVQVLGLGCLTRRGYEPRQLKFAPRTESLKSGALLRDGDFLISRANTPELVGLCGIFRDDGVPTIYPDLMMRLSVGPELEPRFLEVQLLGNDARRRLTALAVGTSSSMAKLNSRSVSQFLIAIPSVDEQRAILKYLAPCTDQLRALQRRLDKLHVQKLGLMQDLLTGKVRVPPHESQAANA